jgi:subtilisin family serine protease
MVKKLLNISLLFLSIIQLNAQHKQNVNIALNKYIQNPNNAETFINLYVRGNKQEIINYIEPLGGKYKYSIGSYHAVYLQSKHVIKLLSQGFVNGSYFENYSAYPLNDTMRYRNNIDSVHFGYFPLSKTYTGKNVLTAFIDTGIDFQHPDFLDTNGNTRVIAIWDHSQPFDAQRTPHYGYGQVWTAADIDQGICTHIDNTSHGTTVAGCTAGNGLASGTHKGVAPDSKILIVETNFSLPNWTSTIADAVDWIYKIADSLNMPCVINASVGTYLGSHDGRDPAAKYIDSLVTAKRGRLMVCAAGNSGNIGNYHLGYTVTADTSFTWFKYRPLTGSSAFPYGVVYFEVWADTADFNNVSYAMGADAVFPDYNYRGRTNFYTISQNLNTLITDTIKNNGNIIGIVDYYAELIGDTYLLQVHMQEPDSNTYNFRFMTTGTGRFDTWSAAWLGISDMVYGANLPNAIVFPEIVKYKAPDSLKIIVSSFSCAPHIVTTANYYNKQTYIDYAGNTQNFPGTENDIAITSSRGPTRDNRPKPEIAATGDITFSAGTLAALAYQTINEPYKVSPDGWHTRNGGTSMAAPVVAGVGALLLEKCPRLNAQEFIDIITATAKHDIYTGNTFPHVSWGYGKINGFRALVATNYQINLSGNTEFCYGDSAIIYTTGIFTDYDWSTADTTPFIVVDTTLQIWLQTTNERGCKSDTAYINTTVYMLPAQPVIIQQADTLFVNPYNPNYTYLWYANGIPYGIGEYVILSTAKSIKVIVIDTNGCENESLEQNYSPNSIPENNTPEIYIYPNPTNGILYVQAINQQINQTDGIIKIYDMTGKEIYTTYQTNHSTTIHINHLSNGIYFIHLTLNNSTYIKKITLLK